MNRPARVVGLVIALVGCRFEHGNVPATVDAPCSDRDHDGVCDDADACPDDPAKTAPGVCGCAVEDGDGDGDGIADCLGCADGEREGFDRIHDYPNIAACAGGWAKPGVIGVAATCSHHAGDDSENVTGTGCSAADLCQAGWHVCASAAEVAAAAATGCADATDGSGSVPVFFVTGQSGSGVLACMPTGNNDLFGCGTLGVAPAVSCTPLTRSSSNLCSALSVPWACGSDAYNEATNVTKPGSDAGGVLCCRTP